MEKKNLVRLSAVGLFAVAALSTVSIVSPIEVKAQVDGTGYRLPNYSDWTCASSGNCLPTVTVMMPK